jgi:hypothetical protein
MSEFPLETLVLGIIGTVTGAIALFISAWTYRNEAPHLKVTVKECKHKITLAADATNKTLYFWVTLLIKNQGDRGTRITDANISFNLGGKDYCFRKKYFRGTKPDAESRWVEAHDTIELSVDFYELYDGEEKNEIECKLTLFHTHGPSEAGATSRIE